MTKEYLNILITEGLKKIKDEAKESTGSGSSGSFNGGPIFSLFSNEAKYNKKKIKSNKIEANEVTGSDSSGSYETTFFLAKNLKNWKPSKNTQIPNGRFVKVKNKCKKFPYCNQGDINSITISKKNKKQR